MADSAFSSDSDARRFFQRAADWFARSERTLAQAHAALLKQVFLGVSRCEDLEQYNTRAVGYFQVSNLMLRKMREAGVEAPDVAPYPMVFAHDFDVVYGATSDVFPTVNVDLRCTPEGFARPNLKVSPRPRSCSPSSAVSQPDVPGTGLGEPVSLTIAVVYSVGAVLVTALVTYGVIKLARVFSGRDKEEFENFMRQDWAADVLRLAQARNDCMEKRFAGIPQGLRPSEEALARQQIAADCAKQIPTPPPPATGGGGFLAFVGTIAVVGAALAGGVYLYRRRHRLTSR